MPSATATAAKKQPLTLEQISKYDDILTDCLVDQTFYSSTIPKNRTTYHPSRGLKEEEITAIIRQNLIVEPNLDLAADKLLALDGLRKFHNALKTSKEKDDFRKHLLRYAQIYLPDCPFEVSTTNRYTIVAYEAAVTARRFIKRGESIKYLSGIQVLITAKEEEEMTKRKKDFSIVVSSRNKCASLFMGPARFANHDCDANARLVITSHSTIEIFATKNIDLGDEITVTYGDNYFGEDNCECLCHTCENNLANGWAQPECDGLVTRSIEEASDEGYRLRRRRRRDDSTTRSSRTPSRTPDIRQRVSRSRTKLLRTDSTRESMTGSPAPELRLRQMKKRAMEVLSSPPATPAKRQKSAHFDATPIPAHDDIVRKSSDMDATTSDSLGSASDSPGGESPMTDLTTPDDDAQAPEMSLQSPNPTPKKECLSQMDIENSDLSLPRAAPRMLRSVEDVSATGIPAANVPNLQGGVHIIQPDDLDIMVIPPPLTPAAKTKVSTQDEKAEGLPGHNATEVPIKRGRGRPKGSGKTKRLAENLESRTTATTVNAPQAMLVKNERSPSPDADMSDENKNQTQANRRPGDYLLTPLLLPEAESAWNWCKLCEGPFVQHDAYFTRAYCPRCERHSKLYGYQWPKTQKAGKNDKEERILDHREIHRFLDPEEEARIRGRKYLGYVPVSQRKEVKATPVKPAIIKKRRSVLVQESDMDYNDSEECEEDAAEGTRRSTRKRKLSLKA